MSADAGIPLLGGVLKGYGQLMQSDAESEALQRSAQTAMQNAAETRKQGAFNAFRQQNTAAKKFGETEAGYGASGIAADSGSALDVMLQSHMNSEFDRLNILHAADVEATNYQNKASSSLKQASDTKRVGQFSAFASVLGGGIQTYQHNAGSGEG